MWVVGGWEKSNKESLRLVIPTGADSDMRPKLSPGVDQSRIDSEGALTTTPPGRPFGTAYAYVFCFHSLLRMTY